MNRNQNSHFALAPQRNDMPRSRFDRPFDLKTTFNAGDIVPIFCSEVLPNDTVTMDSSKVVRMQSLITPLMDNLYLDTYFFFVPNRIIWSHWQECMGENNASPWIPQVEYTVPQVAAPSGGWNKGSLADYFGIPIGIDGFSVSALPFRAYAKIINDWFRSEVLSDPVNLPMGDSNITGNNGTDPVTDIVKGGMPYKACKFHDYFTSALPSPQKGDSVSVAVDGTVAPVYGIDSEPLVLRQRTRSTSGFTQIPSDAYLGAISGYSGSGMGYYNYGFGPAESLGAISPEVLTWEGNVSIDESTSYNIISKESADSNHKTTVYADLSAALGVDVNSLRLAFQMQKLLERDARSGTRYIEIIKAHFGCDSPDARLQRAEYLGGNRIPININQVVQQSETSNTPQGNVAAYSLTADTHSDFTKSFVEHGWLIGLAVVRYDHTYQQGLNQMWTRKSRFDFYWPVLSCISEQPILKKEIYLQGDELGLNHDNSVFGYQEAWASYRYLPSMTTGEMRSSYANSLDIWHLGDDYSQEPSLSDEWIREDASNVDRVIAVSQQNADQFFGDFYFKSKWTRCMPLYSIPGLIDHF